MTRAAIYCRISKDREGKEVGVENQLQAARELAKAHGLTVVAVYTDNDRGASSLSKKDRPQYRAMTQAAERGEFETVIAYSMSRVTRRPSEWEDLIRLSEKHGIDYLYKVSPRYDLRTADGRATARTVAAWDAAEAERIGERVAFAQADKLAKGQDLGGPRPFGYEKDRLTIRESEAALLRTGYQMILDGKSVMAVAKFLDASGAQRDRANDRGWRTQTVRHMLLRPRNIGHLVIKGVTHSTTLPAIVDEETFYAVQSILENPSRRPKRGPEPTKHVASGLIRCGVCDNYLQCRVSKGAWIAACAPQGRRNDIPAGTRHPSLVEHALDADLREQVSLVLMILILNGKSFSTPTPTKELRASLHELQRQRDLAQEMIFAPGANVDNLKKKISDLGVRIENAQSDLDRAVASDVGGEAVKAALQAIEADRLLTDEEAENKATDAFYDHWDGLSVGDKRALVQSLLPNCKLLPANEISDMGSRLSYDKVYN